MNRSYIRCIAMAVLALIGSVAASANQSVIVDCKQGGQLVVTNGLTSTTKVLQSFPSCTITVFTHGVVTPLPGIFSDNSGTVLSNPFTAQNNPYSGAGFFYAANGRYDITISGGGLITPVTFNDVLLNDPASLLGCSQIPALTGDVTSAGGTCATTLPNIASAGTGLKTTINAKGQVTSVTTAASTDLSDTSVIARLNAAANFGSNPVTTGALSSTTATLSGALSGVGATFSAEVGPSVTGVQLGDAAHRWDIFGRNLDFTGSATFANITLATLTASKVNNFYYVDGVTYTTIQAAITAACAGTSGATVYIPAGTYTNNGSFVFCNNLEVAGEGSNGPASIGGTTINTNITSGNLVDINSLIDVHFHDLRFHNTSAGATTSQCIGLHWGQGIIGERFWCDGNFLNGIVLNPVAGVASTITNRFSDFQVIVTAAGGVGCKLDALASVDKVINSNVFSRGICSGSLTGGAGFLTTGGGGAGLTYINENTLDNIQAINSAVGMQFDDSSTSDMLVRNATVEANTLGIRSVNGNYILCENCDLQANTANITNTNGNIVFLRGRGPQLGLQTFKLDQDGNLNVNSLCLKAAVCDPGNINSPNGWAALASGTTSASFFNVDPKLRAPSFNINGGATLTGETGTGPNLVTSIGPTITGGATINGGMTMDTALTVVNGGTGRATLTNHGVLVGAGTPAITQLAVGGANTFLAGVAGADPTFRVIATGDLPAGIVTGAGTTNRLVKYTNGASAIIGNATPTDDGTTFAVGELLTTTGIGINGAGASANVINGAAGWQIQASGGASLTLNSGNVDVNKLLSVDLGSLFAETTAPTNVAASATLWPDSTAHEFKAALAGSSSAGLMVRAQPGVIHQTAQTAAITTATLCAASAGACNVAGTYTVSWSFWEEGTACATPGTGGVTFLLTWTDSNGTVHSATSLAMEDGSAVNAVSGTFHFQTTLAAAWASGSFNISSNGSIIQYATGYTACGVGTGTYGLDIAVTRIR